MGMLFAAGLLPGSLPSRLPGNPLGVSVAQASEYVVGAEDVLSLTVWEHPELSRTVAVQADGTITLPPIGAVPAAGKTTSTLARDLEGRYYSVLRITTQVTVSVIAFNSQKVFLAGQVATPGRFSFEVMPNLVDFLGMTGGLGAGADLSRVRILRKGAVGQGTETVNIDLTKAVQEGDMSGVPSLQSGDVVFVPGVLAGSAMGGENVIYVLGEVVRPGPYSATPGLDLARVLSLAGGVTPMGDMGKVEVLSGGGKEGGFRVRIDLNKEIEAGRGGVDLRAGDMVVVSSRQSGAAGQAWGLFRETLGVSRDVLNLFLIKDVLN